MSWKPTDISGCQLWLDATQITGLSDGATVASWPDKSGNGYNATQETGANKPLYKTNVLNGKPVLRFDGTDDYLSCGDVLDLGSNSMTLFVVWKTNTLSATQGVVGKSYYGDKSGRYGVYLDLTLTGMSFMAQLKGTPAVSTRDWCYYSFSNSSYLTSCQKIDNTAYANTGYENGVQKCSASIGSAYGGADTTDSYLVGCYQGPHQFLNGDIAEVLQYNSALSDTDRQKVEAYLNWKWFGGPDTGGFGDSVFYLPQPILFC